ncbi:MAG: hypothetical protein ACI9F9_000835 [Candidatus Paceibacteria bacterium]|jgi:uncharacterized protein (DUF58 family)
MSPVETREVPLPGVKFAPGFRDAVAALRGMLGAARQSREGSGNSSMLGSGADLMGFRPYRAGEDLRQLDWNLLARLDKPYVRVTRREAGELWVLALDGSASMGTGPPGKLQRAAECCVALWCLAGLQKAEVRLVVSLGENKPPSVLESSNSRGLEIPMAFLESVQAEGPAGLGALLESPRVLRGATRLFCMGDLMDDCVRSLLHARRRIADCHVLQLLAPHEFDPPLGPVDWWDPESGEQVCLEVGAQERLAYQVQLEAKLDSWRELAGAHRFSYAARSSALPFEELVREMIRT